MDVERWCYGCAGGLASRNYVALLLKQPTTLHKTRVACFGYVERSSPGYTKSPNRIHFFTNIHVFGCLVELHMFCFQLSQMWECLLGGLFFDQSDASAIALQPKIRLQYLMFFVELGHYTYGQTENPKLGSVY